MIDLKGDIMKEGIYILGIHSGTVKELSNVCKISRIQMYKRLREFKAGKYTAEQAMTVGYLDKQVKNGSRALNKGTDEWQNIDDRGGDDIDRSLLINFAQQSSSG